MNALQLARSSLSAAALLAATTGAASATPVYQLLTTIAVPADGANVQPGGAFTGFDISYFDPSTQLDYVADRSNAAIDIFSAATNSYVGRVPGFQGQLASTSISGPDGVVVGDTLSGTRLFGGDGDSTLKAFNIPPNPTNPAGYTSAFTTATGATSANRVDEMAFDPKDNLVLAANNAAATPFATLVNASTGAIVSKIVFDGTNGTPNATNGAEQSVWSPTAGKFFISIPQINAGGSGGISEIDPTGKVLQTFNLADFGIASCSPAGLAVSTGGQLLVGCANGGTQTILFDPAADGGAGAVVKTFNQISGTDEVYYDPTLNSFYVTGANNPGGPIIGIIDATTDTYSQSLATTPGNDHSIAVDPISNEIFVPYAGGVADTVCPGGCVAVYAEVQTVPEPGSLPILATGIAALLGLVGVRRHRPSRMV